MAALWSGLPGPVAEVEASVWFTRNLKNTIFDVDELCGEEAQE